jgi:DNA-binding NarL/FixJ family response regulator
VRPISVVVADDHPSTRAGVRAALEGEGFQICAECADAAGAVMAAERYRPDLCLLDVGMPGGGIDAAARITARVPETAVVMLTVSRRGTTTTSSRRSAPGRPATCSRTPRRRGWRRRCAGCSQASRC